MQKAIVIPTSKDKYYRQLFEFLRPISPFNKLNNRDLDVLAGLFTEYMGLKGLDHKQRCSYIFSKDVRKKSTEKIGMSSAAYNNSINKLKKANIIEEGNTIPLYLIKQLIPKSKIEIHFKWKKE